MQFCCQRGFVLVRCGCRVWTYEPSYGATATIGTQTLVTNTVVTNTVVPCSSPQVPYTKRLRKATLFMVAVSVCTPALRYRNRYLSESMLGSPLEPRSIVRKRAVPSLTGSFEYEPPTGNMMLHRLSGGSSYERILTSCLRTWDPKM